MFGYSKVSLLGLLLLAVSLRAGPPNLHIGTGGFGYGCGSNSPAAQLPYSFVRVGPDTSPLIPAQYKNFQHYGGYHDSDEAVRAFSHLHLVGAGVIDMGIFGVLPIIGRDQRGPQVLDQNKVVALSKNDEVARPGYYSVVLPKEDIKVELTSSQRCAAHRYTYSDPKNRPMDIHVMTSYLLDKKSPRNSYTKICGPDCIEGSIKVMGGFGGRFGGYTVHFHLRIAKIFDSQPMQLFLTKDKQVMSKVEEASGNHTGAIIRTKSNVVQLLIGLSYVSIANAKLNFEREVQGKTFEAIRKQAEAIWNQQLMRFDIIAIDKENQVKIDTAIYRTLLTPTIFEDSNDEYMSFRNDGSTSFKPPSMRHVYTDMSLWDVHRSQMPWILLQDPDRFADIAMSIVLINREGQYMPKWPFAQGNTGCMIGAHANTVLADWVVKEASKRASEFDLPEILSFMLRNANEQTIHDSRSAPDQYRSIGFIPFEQGSRSSCSETLEYSYNDYGIAQVAALLNRTSEHDQFIRRSKFYKNLWNNGTKFFQPRYRNGTFKQISYLQRINIFSNFYVEGDAWHYRFYAPHDALGLIDLFGGQKSFVTQLEHLFTRSTSWPTFWLPNPYYWAGNEHDLFSVWLFPFANRSDLTQKFSRLIIDRSYGTTGNGLPGNDDYGTMSAWLVFASLGFYPLPSTQTYVLGSPTVKYARIMRKTGNRLSSLTINANFNNRQNIHVKKVELNSKEFSKFIQHDAFVNNSVLQFWMTP